MPFGAVDSLVLRLTGDGRQYFSMLLQAQAVTRTAMNNIRAIGLGTAAALTAGLGLMLEGAISEFARFESTIGRISALVQLPAAQLAGLSAEARILAVETGRGAIELGEALYFITSAGFAGASAMRILRASSIAAAAGLGETKVVADLLTSILASYGEANVDLTNVLDTLVVAIREGKAEGPEFAANIGKVIPIARELGVDLAQITAAMASMARGGTTAATSAVQLRQVLLTILGPTQQARDMLARYGISAEDLRNRLRGDGLLNTLDYLRHTLGDNIDELEQVFGNLRALQGVVSITGERFEDTRRIFASVAAAGGDMARAFEAIQKTLTFQLARLGALFNELRLQVGEALAPTVKAIVDMMQRFGEFYNAVNPNIKRLILLFGVLAFVLSGLIVVMGLLIPIVTTGAVGLTMLTGIMARSLLPAVTLLVGRFTLFNVASRLLGITAGWLSRMLGGPVLLLLMLGSVIPGMTPLVAGLGSAFRAFGKWFPWLSGLLVRVIPLFRSVWGVLFIIGLIIPQTRRGIDELFSALSRGDFGTALEVLSRGLEQVGQFAAYMYHQLRPVVQQIGNIIGALIEIVLAMVRVLISFIGRITGLDSLLEGINFENVRLAFESIVSWATDALIVVEFVVRHIDKILQIAGTAVLYHLARMGDRIVHYINDVPQAALEWFRKNWLRIFLNVFDWTGTVMRNIARNVVTALSRMSSAVIAFLRNPTRGIQIDTENLWQPLTTGFQGQMLDAFNMPEFIESDFTRWLGGSVQRQASALDRMFVEFFMRRRRDLFPTPVVENLSPTAEQLQGVARFREALGGVRQEAERINAALRGTADALERLQNYRDFLQSMQSYGTMRGTDLSILEREGPRAAAAAQGVASIAQDVYESTVGPTADILRAGIQATQPRQTVGAQIAAYIPPGIQNIGNQVINILQQINGNVANPGLAGAQIAP